MALLALDLPAASHLRLRMLIRPFRNDDPPAMVRLWRRLPPLPFRAQNITTTTLEQHVFAKPYFEREGLLVASEGTEIIGFAHAAFGIAPQGCQFDSSLGVVALFVPPGDKENESVAAALLASAEAYLRDHGAMRAIAGGVSPHHPFYLGFYGGALLPGIVQSDAWTLERFAGAGYRRENERLILRRSLSGFRPPVDRELMRIRRAYRVEDGEAPTCREWCEACTLGTLNRSRFRLVSRASHEMAALIDVWDMEPLSSSWGLNAMGVCWWEGCESRDASLRHLFLLGETMKQLATRGVSMLEVHAEPNDAARRDIYRRLGFEQVERGIVLTKQWSD